MAKISVSFRLDEDIIQKLEDQSKSEKRNKTQHITELIKEEAKRKARK